MKPGDGQVDAARVEVTMAHASGSREERLQTMIRESKRKLWLELREDIFRTLGEQHHARHEMAMDPGDMALADVLEDTGLRIADIRREELTLMDAAERRLAEGTYGICDECGVEISEERLKVVPYALCCVACQQRREGPGYGPGVTL